MNIFRLIKNNQGLTLLELMIAISLFTVVMMISTTMFLRSIDSQTRSISSKSLTESMNYALTIMSDEAAGAIKDPTTCDAVCVDPDAYYCSMSSGTKLAFRNAAGSCTFYEIEIDSSIERLKVTHIDEEASEAEAYLTPKTIRLNSFNVYTGSATDGVLYIGELTMALSGQSLTTENQPDILRLQTSVVR